MEGLKQYGKARDFYTRINGEKDVAMDLIKGFWLAHNDYLKTDEETCEDLSAWTAKGHKIYFILQGQAVIGFVHLGSRGAEIDWIEDLYVKPEYQGKGIGSTALALIEQKVKNIPNQSI